MDEDLRKYYKKQMSELINRIDSCDYTDNAELIDIIGKLAEMTQNILYEL